MWYTHTREYYSPRKRDVVLIHATTYNRPWKYCQVTEGRYKRTNIVWKQLYKISRTGKFLKIETRMLPGAGGKGE